MDTRYPARACWQLRLACLGAGADFGLPFCLDCRQRRTGSAFGVQARFARDQVAIAGDASTFTRSSDNGDTVTFRFCPACGATVCWEREAVPGFLAVAVGAFADPQVPPPRTPAYESRRHGWAVIAPPGEIARLD